MHAERVHVHVLFPIRLHATTQGLVTKLSAIPTGVTADIVHTVVLLVGLTVLVVQRLQLKSKEGLNEAVQKPDFDQVENSLPFKYHDHH